MLDLARKTIDGTVPSLDDIQQLDDNALVDRLTSVRGVGRWTVEMMMIFKLVRSNVLPVADLGIRKGYHFAYNTPELPTAVELVKAGEHWAPYRSVASWYLWRATDSVNWQIDPPLRLTDDL